MDAIADLKVPRCGPGDGLRDYNSGPVATRGQGHHPPDFQPPLAPNNRTNAKHGVSFNVWSEPDAELENYDRVPDLLVPPVSKAARELILEKCHNQDVQAATGRHGGCGPRRARAQHTQNHQQQQTRQTSPLSLLSRTWFLLALFLATDQAAMERLGGCARVRGRRRAEAESPALART